MTVGIDYTDQPMHDLDLVSLLFTAMINPCIICFFNYNFLIILVYMLSFYGKAQCTVVIQK